MMDKAVDHGCGHLVIRKDTAPFRELQVSRLAYLHGKHHLHTVCAVKILAFLQKVCVHHAAVVSRPFSPGPFI